MFRGMYLSPGLQPVNIDSVEDIRTYLAFPEGITYVSIEDATSDELDLVLRGVFNFHPLAIEDCESPGYQAAKIDDYGDYIFLIAHAVDPKQDLSELRTMEIDLFLGKRFVVTCSTDPGIPFLPKLYSLIHKDERLSSKTSDFLCHTILDALVDDYMPLIDQLETEVELLEDSVMEKPNPETLHRVLSLKHSIMELRRIVGPQRELMNRLSRNEFAQVTPESLIYFRDIYDHLVRIQDLTDLIRDIVTGTLDIYLNSTSLRLNEIMKALTIVSTIFLPLTFITGAFGMNFLKIPGATHPWGFYIVGITSIVIGIAMLLYFRKRKWF